MFATFVYEDFNGLAVHGSCEVMRDYEGRLYASGRLGVGKSADTVSGALRNMLADRRLLAFECYDHNPDGSVARGPGTHEVVA
jgi:hypothetical protein